MGLYNRVTGSTGNETIIKEPKPFNPNLYAPPGSFLLQLKNGWR